MAVGKIEIVKKSIVELETDAIVNAANEALREGAGACGVIFKAAGSKYLQAACDAIGGCKIGSAVITPGFGLKSKYIIHAVGPRWTDGKHSEAKLLSSAYKQALSLAVKNSCKSIGFPLISAGIYGYPVDKAWQQAIKACLDFQKKNPKAELDIQFAVIDGKVLEIGKKILVEMKKEKTTAYLTILEDDSLERIKQKVCQESDLLMDKKAHPMAAGLLEVVCDPSVMMQLSLDQFLKVAESIFPEYVQEEAWIEKYCDILLRIIDEARKNNPDDRAAKYEKHLREVLIPALKKGAHSNDIWDDVEPLEDVYKVTACLLRYYTGKDEVFGFDVDGECLANLYRSIQSGKGAGNQILGIVSVPMRIEDRQYAIFLSWILEELLGKQEGLKEVDE